MRTYTALFCTLSLMLVTAIASADEADDAVENDPRLAKTFAKDVTSARTQRTAATAAPYKKAGITGDRLALLVDHIDYAMYGVGGGKLTTPAQLKRAGVIFELLGPDTDGVYILRRYQFHGDALVSTTSGDFVRRPPARFYR